MANETTNIIQRLMYQDVLVSETDVKVLTPISANKAKGTIVKHIVTAQDMKIKKAIGISLYEGLLKEFKANNKNPDLLPDGTGTGTPPQETGDTTNYKLLYEKILKPLAWWAYVLGLSTTAFNPTEQGVIKRGTDESDPASLEELRKIEADGKATAIAYMEQLRSYVEETFKGDETVQEEAVEESKTANAGIFVKKKRWHGNSNY